MSLYGGLVGIKPVSVSAADDSLGKKQRFIAWLRNEAKEELDELSDDEIIRAIHEMKAQQFLDKAELQERELARLNPVHSGQNIGIALGIGLLLLVINRKGNRE